MKKVFRNYFLNLIFAVGFIVSVSGCSNSNDYEIFGAIHGCVTDYTTGTPLDNATITLSPSGISKQTDAYGNYDFNNLEITQYTLTVQKQGYQPNRKTVTVISGENFQIDIQLLPIPEN